VVVMSLLIRIRLIKTILILLLFNVISCSNFVGVFFSKKVSSEEVNCILLAKKWEEVERGQFSISRELGFGGSKLKSVMEIETANSELSVYILWNGTKKVNGSMLQEEGRAFLRESFNTSKKEIKDTKCLKDLNFSCRLDLDGMEAEVDLKSFCDDVWGSD
jgi:hypothetical protein